MKLRGKILLYFALTMGLALVGVAVFGYYFAEKQVEANIHTEMQLAVDGMRSQLVGWLASKSKVVETVGITINNLYSDQSIPKSILQVYSTDPDFSDIYVGYTDGSFMDGGDWIPPADFDPRKRSWYLRAVKQDGLAYSEPFIDAISKTPIISIGFPLKDGRGQLRGVVSGDISLATITQTVQEFNLQDQGYGLLFNEQGVVLAHRDLEMVSENLLKNNLMKAAVQKILQKESGETEFVNEQEVVQSLVYTTLPSTGWKLAIALPKTVVYHELTDLRNKYLVLGGGGILLVLILVLIFTNQLTRPLKHLTEAFNQAADGDLTIRTWVKTKDELGLVSTSYNQMTEQFRELIEKSAALAGSVNQASEQLSKAFLDSSAVSEEVAASIQDVSIRADEQAAAMEKVQGMTQRILHEIQELGSLGTEVGEAAQWTTQNAEDGKNAIEQILHQFAQMQDSVSGTSQVITDLVEKSNQIGKIIDLINGIAAQTQLLALNAAIEAARAGESGRGFAVVADEIKDLAEETVRSAAQISQLIQGTQTEATKANVAIEQSVTDILSGKEVVQDTAGNFTSIFGAATENLNRTVKMKNQGDRVIGFIHEILQDVKDVTGLALDTSASAQEVSAATEEQTATTQEISASADLLHQMADDLTELIEHFQYQKS